MLPGGDKGAGELVVVTAAFLVDPRLLATIRLWSWPKFRNLTRTSHACAVHVTPTTTSTEPVKTDHVACTGVQYQGRC